MPRIREGRVVRILIVNPFGIGDVLFTTPLVRALRRAFPESHIGYLCNRRTEAVLRGNPHVNRLFIYEKDEALRLWKASSRQGLGYVWRLLRDLRGVGFDLVVDLSLGERYSFMLRLLGVPRMVGFNYRRRGRFLTESLPIDGYQEGHVVTYYQQLLQSIGIRLQEGALELRASAEDQRWAQAWLETQGLAAGSLLVGIVPAGGVSWGIGAPFRRWHAEGFAAVADALVERHGATILLFGEQADAATCQQVLRAMHHPALNLSGQTTLGQFVSLLSRLALVLCNDGGPLHLAVSQQVRTVSIFGPVDPAVYGPYPAHDPRHRVVCREELLCRPCYHQFRLPPCPYERACLTTITPGEVLEACSALLQADATV